MPPIPTKYMRGNALVPDCDADITWDSKNDTVFYEKRNFQLFFFASFFQMKYDFLHCSYDILDYKIFFF